MMAGDRDPGGESASLPLAEAVQDLRAQVDGVVQTMAAVTEAISRAHLDAERSGGASSHGGEQDPLDDLLSGAALRAPGPVHERAGLTGFAFGPAHVAAVVGVKGAPHDHSETSDVLPGLAGTLRARLQSHACRSFVALRNDLVLLITAIDEGGSNRTLIRAVEEAIERAPIPSGMTAMSGMGRAEPGIPGIQLSYQQSLQAFRELDGMSRPPTVLTFEDSLPYALLRRNPALTFQLFRASVEPLLAYDARWSTRLVQTLDTYLRTSGNLAQAAKSLHIHRRTLYGRLRRIEYLTGRHLDTPEKFLLELGIRTLHLLPEGLLVTGLSMAASGQSDGPTVGIAHNPGRA